MPIAFAKRIAAVLLSGLLISAGCKKEESMATAPATPALGASTPAAAGGQESFKGVTFDRPAGWTVEKTTDPEGLMVKPPADAEQGLAYVFIESSVNAAEQSLPALLEQSASDLYGSKADFTLKSKETITHPAGFEYGKIVYTNSRNGTALTQWKLIIPVGKESRLFVQTAVPTEAVGKYEPIFQKLTDSIKVEGKK